jgi:hypothetical protein
MGKGGWQGRACKKHYHRNLIWELRITLRRIPGSRQPHLSEQEGITENAIYKWEMPFRFAI